MKEKHGSRPGHLLGGQGGDGAPPEEAGFTIDPSAGPPLPALFLKDTRIKPPCPRCGSPLQRRRRTLLIRLSSLAYPVKRYGCTDVGCGWVGVLPSRHGLAERKEEGLRNALSLAAAGFIALLLLSALALLLMGLWTYLVR